MNSLQGQLLIASPTLLDPNFAQAVLLVVQHDENGALGLIVNRPVELAVREAWAKVSDKPCVIEGSLYQGGPCEGMLMVLHTNAAVAQIQVRPGICFSAEVSSVEWLAAHNVGPIKCLVGYAGWSAGQLESELAQDSWLTVPATPKQVFEELDDQWASLIKYIARANVLPKINPRLIPKDPSFN